jgi:hypothetical protein
MNVTDVTFLDMVDQLTQTHPVTVDTDTGKQIHSEDGLLQQLREAVFGGMEAGGGSAFGAKLPMAEGAFDLLDRIDRQAAEALSLVDPKPTPLGHAEDYVRAWAARVDEGQRVVVSVRATSTDGVVFGELREYTAIGLVYAWYTAVRDFFNPPSRREIRAECPSCGVRTLIRDVDGEKVPVPVFWFRRDGSGRTVDAHCDACDQIWLPSQWEWLAKAIGALALDSSVDDVVAGLA